MSRRICQISPTLQWFIDNADFHIENLEQHLMLLKSGLAFEDTLILLLKCYFFANDLYNIKKFMLCSDCVFDKAFNDDLPAGNIDNDTNLNTVNYIYKNIGYFKLECFDVAFLKHFVYFNTKPVIQTLAYKQCQNEFNFITIINDGWSALYKGKRLSKRKLDEDTEYRLNE